MATRKVNGRVAYRPDRACAPIEPAGDALGGDDLDLHSVQAWFAMNGGWLIVVDNVEDVDATIDLLPSCPTGRILLTTRLTDPGERVFKVEAKLMEKEAGALFLLRRAELLEKGKGLSEADENVRNGALNVSERLGGLPLALERAGAYLAATGCTPLEYLADYEVCRERLLSERGGIKPSAVVTTFNVAVRVLEEHGVYGVAAVRLIQLCAFLDPDSISKVILDRLSENVGALGSFRIERHDWNQVVRAGTEFGLISLNKDKTLRLHRVVGDVVRDDLPSEERRAIAEEFVGIVVGLFPNYPLYENWPRCEALMPHVEALRRRI